MSWRTSIASLLGLPVYSAAPPVAASPSLGSEQVERGRYQRRGQLSQEPYAVPRWHLYDVEDAQVRADKGDLQRAAQLWAQSQTDGVVAGHVDHRCGFAVRLPRKWEGKAEYISALTENRGIRSVFDEMCPESELELLAKDDLGLGLHVAELVPVVGRTFPLLVRRDPQYLRYRWHENQWYYRSLFGEIPIYPGDGRWVLGVSGGRESPWRAGLYQPVGRLYVAKTAADLHNDNWIAKLANAARVAKSPAGATEDQRSDWFQKVAGWGLNTVFEMLPGYEVDLLEGNGQGYQGFKERAERCDLALAVLISGQESTTTGGTGFSNQEVPERREIRLLKKTAANVAYTLNTQVIPQWVVARYGEQAVYESPKLTFDPAQPKEQLNRANTLVQVAASIKGLTEALAMAGATQQIDTAKLCLEFGIPVKGDRDGDAIPDTAPEASDLPEPEPANDTEAIEVEADAEAGPMLCDDEDRQRLAAEMTEHGLDRCMHNRVDRCDRCGVVRDRGVVAGEEGPEYKVAWKAIEAA